LAPLLALLALPLALLLALLAPQLVLARVLLLALLALPLALLALPLALLLVLALLSDGAGLLLQQLHVLGVACVGVVPRVGLLPFDR
jgi:hypothetical protein